MNITKLILHTLMFWWLIFFMTSLTFAQTQPAAWPNINGCKGLTDGYSFVDTNFQNPTEGYMEDCSCKPKYKKITKTIQNASGVTQNITVCEECNKDTCNCGVKLNTDIPFIVSCLMYGNTNNINENGDGTTTVNGINAFPILMGALIRLLVSIILIASFGTIIVGWFMMTIPEQFKTGKDLVMKVVWTIASLWSLWIILYLINPNFFK